MADDQHAQAQQITELRASFGDVDARLMTEQTVRAEADKALAQQVTTLAGTVGDNNAQLNQQLQVLVDTDSAQAKLINDLTSRTGANEASVTALSQTLTDSNSATAQQIGALQSATGDNTSAITSLSKTVTDNQSATATELGSLNSAVGSNTSAISSLSETVTDNQKSTSQQITNLSTSVGGNTAEIEKRAQTIFDMAGIGKATFSLKTGVNYKGQYHSAGMAIGVETRADGSVDRQVLFDANRFAFLDSSTSKVSLPFTIQNGQTFINSAFIADGTITNAKIGNYISSDNYNWDNKTGWVISKTGDAAFNSVTIRGHIEAWSGYFNGAIYADSGVLNNVTINESCTIKGTLDASNITGDIYNTQSGGIYVTPVTPFSSGFSWSGQSGDHILWNIIGENFDRVMDTNVTVYAMSYNRQYFSLVLVSPGYADTLLAFKDTGNRGENGPMTHLIADVRLPRIGRGQQHKLIMRIGESRDGTVTISTPILSGSGNSAVYASPKLQVYKAGRIIATSGPI